MNPSGVFHILFCSALIVVTDADFGLAQSGVIVENGTTQSAIVVGSVRPELARLAAEDLQWHLERASGASIRIVEEVDADELKDIATRFVVGDGRLSRTLGVTSEKLTPEQYRILSVGRDVVIVGHDTGENPKRRPIHPNASPATLFGVSHLLDRYLGVRWLWPGELGTFVPKHRSITLPRLDITDRPDLEARGFMMALPRNRSVAGTPNKTHDRMVAEAYH